MTDVEAVATASVPPGEALQRLRALLTDVECSNVEEAAETAYEALRSVVWQFVSGRAEGDEPRAWADVVLRVRQSLRLKGSPIAERLTTLYDMLDQTVRFGELATVRRSTTGANVAAILKCIQEHGGEARRGLIAEKTGIRSSNLSRILSNMCAEGLISRASRGREVVVSIAPEGRRRLGVTTDVCVSMPWDGLVDGAAARRIVRDLWPSTGCVMAVADHHGTLVACDAGFASLFGVEEASLAGLSVERIRSRFDEALDLGGGALEGRTPDGRVLQITAHSAEHGTIWMGFDVTSYREALSAARIRERQFAREVTTEREGRGRTLAAHLRPSDRGARWALDVLADHGPELLSGITAINCYAELMTSQTFGPVGNWRYANYAKEMALCSLHLHDFLGHVVMVAGLNDLADGEQMNVVPKKLLEEAVSGVIDRTQEKHVAVSLAPSTEATIRVNGHAASAVAQLVVNGMIGMVPFGSPVAFASFVEAGRLVFKVTSQGTVWPGRGRSGFTTACQGLADSYGGDFRMEASTGDGIVTTLALPIASQRRT
ncbi:DUF7343 domain-containing protein [Methylobacterium sp. NPDC080182]|uniref:DUF7343 domain-containing protein n=1 Tax=Methylobacterium sp. NPDC080182 TaxID=3390590 RepID=UPI003CFF5ECC